MSNRAQRRQRHLFIKSDGIVHHLERGIEVEIAGDQLTKIIERDPLAGIGPTDHVWAMFAMYRVDPTRLQGGQSHLDAEALITIAGPGCYRCEQPYTEAIAATSCPGEP